MTPRSRHARTARSRSTRTSTHTRIRGSADVPGLVDRMWTPRRGRSPPRPPGAGVAERRAASAGHDPDGRVHHLHPPLTTPIGRGPSAALDASQRSEGPRSVRHPYPVIRRTEVRRLLNLQTRSPRVISVRPPSSSSGTAEPAKDVVCPTRRPPTRVTPRYGRAAVTIRGTPAPGVFRTRAPCWPRVSWDLSAPSVPQPTTRPTEAHRREPPSTQRWPQPRLSRCSTGTASASNPHGADPHQRDAAAQSRLRSMVLLRDGGGITCQGAADGSYDMDIDLGCGGDVHVVGREQAGMTRWHDAEGRALKSEVRRKVVDRLTLSGTDEPAVHLSIHEARHYHYPVPGASPSECSATAARCSAAFRAGRRCCSRTRTPRLRPGRRERTGGRSVATSTAGRASRRLDEAIVGA